MKPAQNFFSKQIISFNPLLPRRIITEPRKPARRQTSRGPSGKMPSMTCVPAVPHPAFDPLLRVALQKLLFQIWKPPHILQAADLVRDAIKVGTESQNLLPSQFAYVVDVPKQMLHRGLFFRIVHELRDKGDPKDSPSFNQCADLVVLQIAPVRTDGEIGRAHV